VSNKGRLAPRSASAVERKAERRECRPQRQWWRGDEAAEPRGLAWSQPPRASHWWRPPSPEGDPVQEIDHAFFGGCPGGSTSTSNPTPMSKVRRKPRKKAQFHGSRIRPPAHRPSRRRGHRHRAPKNWWPPCRPGAGDGDSVRSFSSFTSGVHALRDKAAGVRHQDRGPRVHRPLRDHHLRPCSRMRASKSAARPSTSLPLPLRLLAGQRPAPQRRARQEDRRAGCAVAPATSRAEGARQGPLRQKVLPEPSGAR